MFKRKTVFVIGAGCSKEFGLPLGSELRDDVHKLVSKARTAEVDALEYAFTTSGIPMANANVGVRFNQLKNGLHTRPSVDQYLDFHRTDVALVALGKMAISQAILEREVKSNLSDEILGAGLSLISTTWISQLFYLMCDSTAIESPSDIFANVSFICFNYDRCIEKFFLYALTHLSGRGWTDSVNIVSKYLNIVHPYGTIDSLNLAHPQSITNGDAFFPVEGMVGMLKQAPRFLRTFTEGITDQDQMRAIKEIMVGSEQIIFLGFSFLDQNMELLKLPHGTPLSIVYANCFGLSHTDQNIARNLVASTLQLTSLPIIQTSVLTASNFMSQFGNAMVR
jgi:hypothetical protein